MNREKGLELFDETRIVVILRGIGREAILPVAEALYEGGIRVLEITLNTIGAFYMIQDLQKRLGKQMFIGAGTVLDTKDARDAADAGASFFVTPNTDKRVIRFGIDEDIPVFAGAMTPTEIVKAWKSGATAVKLFPTSVMGLPYVKELMGPLHHIPMLAVGGVTMENAAEYIRTGCKGLGIGSAVVSGEDLAQGRYDRITEKAAAMTAIVRQAAAELVKP